MSGHDSLPAEQVQKAAASLKAMLPEYRELLSFYQQLFTAREKNRLQISLEPVKIAPEVLNLKRRERLPLVEVTEFVFDATAGRELLTEICNIIQASDNDMAASAARIAAAADRDLEIDALFRHLLSGDDAVFQDIAGRLGCDKRALAFVAYNSLQPSLAVCAEQLSTYLKDRADWNSGNCPVCGSPAAIGVLNADGGRLLCCSFCWHQWPLPRVHCPFCGNTDGKKLHYLYSETEKALRANCCDACRKYIKVVDAREADRVVYPPLEQVASLHMDIKAREAGFDAGIPLHLPID